MRGLIVYGKDGYEDGGEFVSQVDEIVKSSPDIGFAIAEEMSIAVDGNDVIVLLPDDTRITKDENLPEWVMMRTSDWKSALTFESMGVPCFPSALYILAASDKMASHIMMSPFLSSLKTICRISDREDESSSCGIPIPYMMKATTGFGGDSVKRISSEEEGKAYAEELKDNGLSPIFQMLAKSPDDLRVYILGDEIIHSILRRAKDGNDKANFCQGATGIPYELKEEDKEMILQAVDMFDGDLGFISIDFLFDDNGNMVFNEMNCFPGLSGLVQMGVADRFVEKYIEHIEESVGSAKENMPMQKSKYKRSKNLTEM